MKTTWHLTAQLQAQQSVKAYVDTSQKAAGISMTGKLTQLTVTQEMESLANHTLSSATVLYFDDVENNGVA